MRGLTFLQISDSHIGFDKPANPNARGTLEEAVGKINAMPVKPSFMLHTGDISHLSKVSEFDDADRIISQTRLDVHYVPGEHDFLDEDRKLYLDRYGRGSKGAGWYSFDAGGVHFIGLVNVVDLKAGGLGNLGADQLAWLAADVKDRSASTPIVVFAHIPLWTVYPEWGWGTEDGGRALELSQAFRLGDGAQRPHPSSDAEGRRQRRFPYRALDRLSAAGARHRALARPDEGARRQAAERPGRGEHQIRPRQGAARHHRHAAARLKERAMRNTSRRALIAAALGGVCALPLAALVLPTHAQNAPVPIAIDNFTFNPQKLTVKAGTTVTWTNKDDIPHAIADGEQTIQIEDARHRRRLFVHIHHTGKLRIFLLAASAHDRHGRGRSGSRREHDAIMLDRTRPPAPTCFVDSRAKNHVR